jgi:hypothetical protein
MMRPISVSREINKGYTESNRSYSPEGDALPPKC